VTGIAVPIGRVVAGALGAILIYSALFLYKEEEGGLENRIEQWWQRIRDLHAHAISGQTAFVKVVADKTSQGFTKLFGERLFGPKAISASMCYSQAAVFLLATIVIIYPATVRQEVQLRLTFGTLCLFFLLLGSFGPFAHRQSQKGFWLSSVLIVTAGWPALATAVLNRILPSHPPKYEWSAVAYGIELAAILIAVASDFFFIALTRVMLARAAQSNSFIKIVALALGNASLAAVLFIVPSAIGLFAPIYRPLGVVSGGPPLRLIQEVELVFLFVAASNLLDALVSLSWFLIAIMMLLHRLLWPLIERPVYALFRHRVFSEQKKLVFFSGVALLGLAIPSVGHALENVVKAVHG
jgi:hypothetical protein